MAIDRQRIYHKRDRLRQLRAFCQAARLRSITEAANHLRLTQPAISLHVRELENELEALLFDRSGARIRLTPAGELLHELAAPLVEGMDALSTTFGEQLDDTNTGEVRLAASQAVATYVLPSFLRRYQTRYPGIRLFVKNCLLNEGVNLLLADEVEFVVGMRDLIPEDVLEYRQIFTYDIVLITALDHPLAGRATVSPEEASAYPAVVPAPGSYSRYYGETASRQFGLDAKIAIEVGGWGVMKRYVEAGFGIAVVPSVCVTERDRLSVIPLKEYFPSRSYGLITRRGKFISPAARRLMRLMDPEFPDSDPLTHGRTRNV